MPKFTICILLTALFITSSSRPEATHGPTDESAGYGNATTGSALWDGLLRDCRNPSMACVQKNMYHYLDDIFSYQGDVNITKFMYLRRNRVDFTKYTPEANATEPEEKKEKHEKEKEEEEDLPESPLEEVTHALEQKSLKFLMTHDAEIQLPATYFEGAILKVAPRALEEDGVLVKLTLLPKQLEENVASGRILKKIKDFLKNKLAKAFMALLLIIGLIKVFLMFLLPIVVGVATAKKILLKVLLFLFPALSHLFKLCSYYHANYHNTKYHHHHHEIAHIHHVPLHHHLPDAHSHHPPPPPPPPYKHEPVEIEYTGPGIGYGVGPEYISNRYAFDYTPSPNDENEIKSWGLGHVQGYKGSRHGPQNKIGTKGQLDDVKLLTEKETLVKRRLQQEQQRLRQENIRLQEQLKQELKLQEQLKLQAVILAQHKAVLPQTAASNPQQQQQQQQQVFPQKITSPAPARPKLSFDPFYSPILQKIDKIFVKLGVNDEPCRERLVCSMYKNPVKFSPHSNLLSAELSRDSKDLQKPTSSNDAVVRFYRYVQAARDGQDQRECLRLYPSCSINTEL